jgi:hypothetical protein
VTMEELFLWLFGGLGASLIGWAVVRLRVLVPRLLLRHRVKVNAFTADDAPYMDDFYDLFTAKIGAARQNVYITGEGFDCTTLEGRDRALRMVRATQKALRNGARVVRLQTRLTIDSEWLKYLKELMADHPRAFELYAVKDPKAFQTASVCAIDVEDPDNSCTELMLQLERHFGTGSRDVAGTALFITGHQLLAEAIRDRILSAIRDSEIVTRIQSPEHADAFFRGEYYFAYGSNMCQDQMLSRCPSAIKVAVGVVSDNRLVFNRRGSYRPGGVASIEEATGERVYGIIWKMSAEEFAHLDETEDASAYRREERIVHSLQGDSFNCHLYRSIPQGPVRADPQYLEVLIACAKKEGLPADYVQSLHALAEQEGERLSSIAEGSDASLESGPHA